MKRLFAVWLTAGLVVSGAASSAAAAGARAALSGNFANDATNGGIGASPIRNRV